MLVVEQSGNGGGAKEAEAVAAADKQDGSGKHYCKIHRTKGHDLQSCKKVEQLVEQQKAEYEWRDKEKAQEGAGGSGKKAKACGSDKEIAAGTNHQAVAVADKQDSTNKQYCKIHCTKGHDLQSCKKVEQLVEQQKAEYE